MQADLFTREIVQRYSASAAIAVFITGGLLLVMHHAIDSQETEITIAPPSPNLQLLPTIPDETLPVRPPKVSEPPKPEKLPPLPLQSINPDGGGWSDAQQPKTAPGLVHISLDQGLAEGDYLPIMKVPPEYPNRMLSRGIEGWVLVEFTVDKLGRVQAPRVIDAQPGSGFNTSALRAVMRYKYRPRVVDGKTVRVEGVRQRIVFNVSV